MDATITFTVNGRPRTVTTDPERPLLDVLREDLQLTGAKYGCGEANQGNGNVVDDVTREYAYDALNRLKTVKRKDNGTSTLIATYTYDALGRRIRKEVENGGLPEESGLNGTTDYLYVGVQCVEEQDVGGEAPAVLRQYVWGLYVDELIQQKEKGSPDTDYYLLSDLLYRSVALTDDPAEGDVAVVEAYDTDAYGNTLVYSEPGNDDTWFTDDDVNIDDDPNRDWPLCRFVFTGREYDYETAIYFYRARYYHTELGRFVSRDPIEYDEAMNQYDLVGNNPAAGTDTLGLQRYVPPQQAKCPNGEWTAGPSAGVSVGLAVGRERGIVVYTCLQKAVVGEVKFFNCRGEEVCKAQILMRAYCKVVYKSFLAGKVAGAGVSAQIPGASRVSGAYTCAHLGPTAYGLVGSGSLGGGFSASFSYQVAQYKPPGGGPSEAVRYSGVEAGYGASIPVAYGYIETSTTIMSAWYDENETVGLDECFRKMQEDLSGQGPFTSKMEWKIEGVCPPPR